MTRVALLFVSFFCRGGGSICQRNRYSIFSLFSDGIVFQLTARGGGGGVAGRPDAYLDVCLCEKDNRE